MPTSLKVLLSLAIVVVCAAAGGLLGAGIVMGCLRAGEMGPGAGVAVMLFGVIGLLVGLVFGTVCIIMFWRHMWVPVVSLPPVQGDTTGAVWPPAPRRATG